jgi:hypothetical protein
MSRLNCDCISSQSIAPRIYPTADQISYCQIIIINNKYSLSQFDFPAEESGHHGNRHIATTSSSKVSTNQTSFSITTTFVIGYTCNMAANCGNQLIISISLQTRIMPHMAAVLLICIIEFSRVAMATRNPLICCCYGDPQIAITTKK